MERKRIVFGGTGVTSVKAYGKIKFPFTELKPTKTNEKYSPELEKKRFETAVKSTIKSTKALAQRARETIGENEAQIFEIHAMLLEDEDFLDSVYLEIEKGKSAEDSVLESGEKYSYILRSLGDEYLSARATDIKDVCYGIIDTLSAKTEKNIQEDEQYILVANDLTPTETVKLDKSKILGFATFEGTPSSHTAILARAMAIPAVVGIGKIPKEFDGMYAILDGIKGRLIINPSENEVLELENERKREEKIVKEHERYLRSIMHRPAVTESGQKVLIYANIGDIDEVDGALSNGAEGIGLLRSEFMYLARESEPSEDALFKIYKEIAIKMQGKRVVIRTLDIGADKQISYLPLEKEENPALGLRGVRLCLDRKELFKSQIRAILKASAFGRVSIMIPMISTKKEVLECKELIEKSKKELLMAGINFDSKIEIGIMIETPASAIISDILAREVDFFSVGTNDLTQYTYAIDRQNSRVSRIGDESHEAIMRLIKFSADAIHEAGGWIGVCGEMAADLSLTQDFVDIGIDELSVSVPYLLGVRGKVSSCK
ncbi:MAG: phosphoenolpyruvate--protein phosphotransferase [Clostridia bacterium]|nr:phosphoenolpyruvate--protein phosphotransferase [Clostridia bacterium]